MQISRQDVADQIARFLHHEQSLNALVDWAETALMNGKLDDSNPRELGEIIGRLGVADVRNFGLTWEECERMLNDLGCAVEIRILPAS